MESKPKKILWLVYCTSKPILLSAYICVNYTKWNQICNCKIFYFLF